MQLLARSSARVGLFALLAAGSLGLKAAVGPARDRLFSADPARFEQAAEHVLASQGFARTRRIYQYRTNLIVGEREGCRVAVRDASITSLGPAFAKDVQAIGPIQYLYRGKSYDRPPAVRVRLGRLETEFLGRLGVARPMPVLVGFAASKLCPSSYFGLADLRLQT